MNIIKIVGLLSLALVLGGCATTKKPSITNDGWMVVGKKDGVEVHVYERIQPYHQHERLTYDVRVTNSNSYAVCASPHWRLDDLDNHTSRWIFLPGRTTHETGQLIQHVWYYGNTYMLMPPSGMVYDMFVVRAIVADNGTYECVANSAGVAK